MSKTMDEQQVREIGQTLKKHFPIEWGNLRTSPTAFFASAKSQNGRLAIDARAVEDDDRSWIVEIEITNNRTILVNGSVIGIPGEPLESTLTEVAQQVKKAWEEFSAEISSLIASPNESDRWDWVKTEDGFTFHLQPDGTWSDGDLAFDYCPTDGFFIHQITERVVQLKACQQKANGLFWLGEIQVSADDMWKLDYWECDGHPGYVGDRPSESK